MECVYAHVSMSVRVTCLCVCACVFVCLGTSVCFDGSPPSFSLSVVSDTLPQACGICFPKKQLSSQVGCLHFLSSPAVPESLVSQSEGQGNLLAISLAAKLFSLQLPLLQLAELSFSLSTLRVLCGLSITPTDIIFRYSILFTSPVKVILAMRHFIYFPRGR